jgi:carbohydrate-selective porin OprB
MGPLTNATDTYFDRKSDWTGSSGFNWMIESAPMLQQHIDGGAGSQSNIETNLIGQWSVIDKTDSKRGNVLAWHQYASTLGSRTTTEWKDRLGVISPPNGGDTHPSGSHDLLQHFAWEQYFAEERVRIQVGQLTTRVLFNLNRYAISDREDFFTPMIVNNPVAHYTARVGFGAYVEYRADDWYASGMIRDADADPENRFIDFDSLSTGNWEYVAELGFTPGDLLGLGRGVYRLTVSRSDATGDTSSGLPSTGSVSLSFDQDFGDRIGAFFRFATSDDTFRTFDRRIATGLQLKRPFGFANDHVGVGLWWGSPTDNSLRSETGIDFFWQLQIAKFMEVSAGGQVIFDPAVRTDKDSVVLGQIRIRLIF